MLGLSLACSSGSREREPDPVIEAEIETATPATLETSATDEPHAPTVGAPAPALALDSLSGARVQLPAQTGEAPGERATVLIFGSFS